MVSSSFLRQLFVVLVYVSSPVALAAAARKTADLHTEPGPAARKSPSEKAAGCRCVALTFDDGPDKRTTPRLLDILSREGVKATFYLVGSRIAGARGVVREMRDEGHEIGNHSWDHRELTRLSPERVLQEIRSTDEAIEAATGARPQTLRAPYGSLDRAVRKDFKRPFIAWDIDTLDWKYHSVSRITATVLSESRPGSIILLHDIHRTTVDAVEGIIDGLRSRGFSFVTVSQLLHPKG